jgi:hypothetical protein
VGGAAFSGLPWQDEQVSEPTSTRPFTWMATLTLDEVYPSWQPLQLGFELCGAGGGSA